MGVARFFCAVFSELSTTLEMRGNHLALFALLSSLMAYASGRRCQCDSSKAQYITKRGFRYCCDRTNQGINNCEIIEKKNNFINPCNCGWFEEKLDCSPYISDFD